MQRRSNPNGGTALPFVSTGRLPRPESGSALVAEAHVQSNTEGTNSQVYPALARVPSDLFGVCVVGTSGNVHAIGDSDHQFSIMSVSKPFVFALVCRCRSRAREARGKRHRLAVQFARRRRTQPGRTNQSNGQCRSNRDDQPRAGHDLRREVAIHPRALPAASLR